MKKIVLITITYIIIGIVGISQTYTKAVGAGEEGEKEKVINNEKIKMDLDIGDVTIQEGHNSSFYIKQTGRYIKS